MLGGPAQHLAVNEPSRSERAPWSPMGIAIITVLLSPLSGGVLHALNYARLGQPERRRLALASNLITTTLLFFVTSYAGLMRGLAWATALIIAAYFYNSQEGLFRRYRSAGGQKASLLLPGILSVIVLTIAAVGLSYAEDIRYQKDFEEAVRLMEEGKTTEAERAFRACQVVYPDDVASYWNLALIYERSGDIEKAKQELRMFISRNQNSQEVQEYLDRLELMGHSAEGSIRTPNPSMQRTPGLAPRLR